jgi:hypothetical protein
MINLEKYMVFESQIDGSLYQMAKKLLSHTAVWRRTKDWLSNNKSTVEIKYDPELPVEAQFDESDSTKENLVIICSFSPQKIERHEGSVAHELVHAIQFLEGNLDLFITDATREFSSLSDDINWQKFMMAIYLTDPIEIEAWNAEMKYEHPSIIREMIPFMDRTSAEQLIQDIKSIKPNPNEWDLESMEDFPELWGDVYQNYGGNNSEMKMLGKMSLDEFILYWDQKFKSYRRDLHRGAP